MIDLKELLKAGVHFGHKSSRWSPRMHPFIWGSKNKIHLINIAKTAFLLEKASKYLKDLATQGKSILWIGTKKPAQAIIKKTTDTLKMPFVINRWIGGTLTNFDQVKKAITRFIYLQEVLKKTPSHFKKEISMIQKEIARLEKNIGGIIDLDFPPAAIVLIDAKKEHSAVREAMNTRIPVIAMVDTNTDPEGINFIIPSNDDSPRSIACIINYMTSYVQEGQKIYNENKKEEELKKVEAAVITKKEPAVKIKPVPKKEENTVIKEEKKATPVKTKSASPKKTESETKTIEKKTEVKTKESTPTKSKTVTKKATTSKTAPANSTSKKMTKN